jgi:hypothetical protein
MFTNAATAREVEAITYIRSWPSWSRPLALACSDGQAYVVKALQPGNPLMGRSMITEQIVAKLGKAIGCPVPEVALVVVTDELKAIEPALDHVVAGYAHGSLLMANCGDRIGIEPPATERNRRAYAALAVLYGWARAGDHQLVSRLDTDRDVFSVDHGFFFPDAPGWTEASLTAAGAVGLEPQFMPFVQMPDLAPVLDLLRVVSDQFLADAVGAVPGAWGFTAAERVAVAEYLATRRATLVSILEGMI